MARMPSAIARLVVALGAASAFSVVALSCSSSVAPTPCSAATCDGCCQDGVCKPVADQDPAACGTGGGECEACIAGQSCNAGVCTDGGTTNPGTCGARGQACCSQGAACLTGLECKSGTCGDPDNGGGGTTAAGEACSSNSECAGSTSVCAQIGFPGGYCTKRCTTTADCPNGTTCGRDPTDPSAQICLNSCATAGSTTGCRTGYVCDKRLSLDGTPQCIPGCTSPATCGEATTCTGGFCCGAPGYACCGGSTCDGGATCVNGYCQADAGAGAIGAACNDGSADCTSGKCEVEIPQGTTGHPYCTTTDCWPGGYCTQDCGTNVCPQGSACSRFFDPDLCLDLCTYDGGKSDCRDGYVCDRGWIGTDSSIAVCVTACGSASDCDAGAQCNGGFCCGLPGLSCCGGVGGDCTSGSCNGLGLCQ